MRRMMPTSMTSHASAMASSMAPTNQETRVGDGAQDLVHTAGVTMEQNLIAAHWRCHLVGEFDRGVVAFHRQLANQTGEQWRRFLDDLVLAAQLNLIGWLTVAGLLNRQGFAGQEKARQVVEGKGWDGTVGVAVEKRRAVAGREYFDLDLNWSRSGGGHWGFSGWKSASRSASIGKRSEKNDFFSQSSSLSLAASRHLPLCHTQPRNSFTGISPV
jgi:hypothetical protein